jgi:uncharacterized protein YkwD
VTRSPEATRRNRRPLALLAPAVAALLLLLMGCTPEQQAVLGKTNASRTEAGVPEMLPSPDAMNKAQAWADQVARSGALAHSTLADGMPAGWTKLGENVGRGSSIDAVFQGFLNSPGHRANLLDPAFNWVGTGVAVSPDGTVIVVQVFARY